jgi:hypothetical protein
MTVVRVLVLALLALPLVLAAPAAPAAAAQCDAEFASLTAAIVAADLDPKTEASVLGKVQDAQAKLAAGKPADAAQKLTDLTSALAPLEQDGKVSAADAAAIRAATEAALQCVTASS